MGSLIGEYGIEFTARKGNFSFSKSSDDDGYSGKVSYPKEESLEQRQDHRSLCSQLPDRNITRERHSSLQDKLQHH